MDRSRAIPHSHHGVERETRLELATLTLAKYRSNSVFGKGRKWPVNEYLPALSTGIHGDHTGIDADHMAFHAEHKTTRMDGDPVGPAVRGNLVQGDVERLNATP
jgi:hypothetical protein